MKENHKVLFNLSLVFVVSRIIFYMFGVRFDANTLHYLQVLDIDLLKTRLLESLWYLHSQPPLFNLTLGLGLKIFPHGFPLVFNTVYLGMGYLLTLAVYLLMIKLGVGRKLSFLLTALFIVNPAVILHENWLFYSYPVTVLLCLSALFLHRYLQYGRTRDLAGFFASTALLVLLRSLFHIFWFAAGVLVLLYTRKGERKKILLTSLVPLIILNGVYLKNYFISGSYTTSSTWFGWSVAGMTIPYINDDELHQLRNDQAISSITDAEFGNAMDTGKIFAKHHDIPKTGIPVLDRRMKSDGRTPNFNSRLTLETSRLYLQDGLYVLKHYPQAYGRALKRAYFGFLFPGPTDIRMVNRPVLRDYEDLYNFMFMHLTRINSRDVNWYSSVLYPVRWDLMSLILFSLVVEFYAVLFFFAAWKLVESFKRTPPNRPETLTLLYITVTMFYLVLSTNALETVGNNRYRFTIDPFLWIFSGLLITHFKNRWRSKESRAPCS